MSYATPIGQSERIQEIDIIRGFALFGVLLINLIVQSFRLAPWGSFDALPTSHMDAIIVAGAFALVMGKAMTLFSLLFGYGFAMMISRLEDRGVNAAQVFTRRLAILLLIGLTHILLIFYGDILHSYALLGFALLVTRKWSNRSLLTCGLILTLLSPAIVEYLLSVLYDKPYPWWAVAAEGAARRFDLLQGSDYQAYVGELWRMAREETWGSPEDLSYWPVTLGRFMLGAWVFRQGWLQSPAQYAHLFKRWSVLLVSGGLFFALVAKATESINFSLYFAIAPVPELLLGLGYGAAIVVLCQKENLRRWLSGIAALGRMALTGYLMQSIVYLFVLYGFGFGLLKVLGGTTCLVIALFTFGFQIVFSQWWLARYRFGPVEWFWRSMTYGRWQPFHNVESAA